MVYPAIYLPTYWSLNRNETSSPAKKNHQSIITHGKDWPINFRLNCSLHFPTISYTLNTGLDNYFNKCLQSSQNFRMSKNIHKVSRSLILKVRKWIYSKKCWGGLFLTNWSYKDKKIISITIWQSCTNFLKPKHW